MRRLKWYEQFFYQFGLALVALFVLTPVWGMAYLAFDGGVKGWPTTFRLWPEQPTLEVFQRVWERPSQSLPFAGILKNSLLVSGGAALFSVALGASMAYAFARYRFPGRQTGLFALLVGALNSVDKAQLLSEQYSPLPEYWQEHPLAGEIGAVASGSFKLRQPPEIKGSGYVVVALEAALWAFYHSHDFRQGCLLAVNLGNDADTTGAIYGQLAGAYYGETAIPSEWRERLALRGKIETYAEGLYVFSAG